jgi:hypothetical protein
MSQWSERVRDRIELLKRLAWAGSGLLAALVALTVVAAAAGGRYACLYGIQATACAAS